ncbi:MAG: hypothetical protein N2250_09345, partial [Pseudothermotoga sp.]|nr:hypothetical protein [Pseudothermotoga sp.]
SNLRGMETTSWGMKKMDILKILGIDQKMVEGLITRGESFFKLLTDYLSASKALLEKMDKKCDEILKRVVKDEALKGDNRGG